MRAIQRSQALTIVQNQTCGTSLGSDDAGDFRMLLGREVRGALAAGAAGGSLSIFWVFSCLNPGRPDAFRMTHLRRQVRRPTHLVRDLGPDREPCRGFSEHERRVLGGSC